MRQMKDSGVDWIGEIPSVWKLSKIGALYEERNVKVSDSEYQPLSVTKKGIVPQLETAAKTDNGDNRKLIKKNDFVINSRSDRRGSCGISEYDGSCSLINTVLKPRKNMCNAYYDFVFHSDLFADEFYAWGNGIVDDLWSTKWSSMKRIYIPAPPLSEQQRIADYLDEKCSKIDKIIAKQELIIQKLREYYLSRIADIIESYNDASHNINFRRVITNVEQGWSPSPAERKDENGWKVLTLAAVKNGLFHSQETKAFVGNQEKCKSLLLKEGDFLLTRSNTRNLVGQVCIVDKTMKNTIFSDLIYRISFDENLILPKYALFMMQSTFLRQQIERDAHGSSSTMVKITHKDISGWNILLPSIEEQNQICKLLSKLHVQINKEIEGREKIVSKLNEYKKSLIYEVVTGKKEV